METIRSYIDNLFRSYSHTPRVQKARAELLEIMEDKYNELKSQGRSENEAIGIVISEFGNMEEIAAELEAFGKQFGIRIAAGVVLCIVSVLPAVLLDALSAGEAGYSDLSGAFLFFLVAAGDSCFITAGVRKDSYEILLGIGKVSAPSGKEDKVMSVVSSVYWLTVTLIYLLWSFYNNAWVTSWVIWPVAGIAFGIVSVIVKAVTGKEN